MTTLDAGEYAPCSGEYRMVKNGKTINTVYVEKGDKMPPTMESGCHYEI